MIQALPYIRAEDILKRGRIFPSELSVAYVDCHAFDFGVGREAKWVVGSELLSVRRR